jgi:hypothetical protein
MSRMEYRYKAPFCLSQGKRGRGLIRYRLGEDENTSLLLIGYSWAAHLKKERVVCVFHQPLAFLLVQGLLSLA